MQGDYLDSRSGVSGTLKAGEWAPPQFYLADQVELVFSPGDNNTLEVLLSIAEGETVAVDWGDGSSDSCMDVAQLRHTYAQAGQRTITLSGASHINMLHRL